MFSGPGGRRTVKRRPLAGTGEKRLIQGLIFSLMSDILKKLRRISAEPVCSGIEVVITGLTRNQFAGNCTRVRIPPAAPFNKTDRQRVGLSYFIKFYWLDVHKRTTLQHFLFTGRKIFCTYYL